MHIIHYYQRGKVRTGAEKRVRRMNTVVAAIQIALMIYSVIQYNSASSDTYTATDDGKVVVSNQGFRNALAKCPGTLTLSRTPFSYQVAVDGSTVALYVFRTVAGGRLSLIVCGVYIFMSILSKVLFEFNVRKIQIRSMYFWKSSVTVVEFAFLIASYVLVSDVNTLAEALRRYFNSCRVSGSLLMTAYIPFTFQYAILALSTAWELVLLGFALYNGLKKCRLDDPDLMYDEFGDVICRRDGDPLTAQDVENNMYHKPRISTEEYGRHSPLRPETLANLARQNDLPMRRAPPFNNADEATRMRPIMSASNARFAHVGALPNRRYN